MQIRMKQVAGLAAALDEKVNNSGGTIDGTLNFVDTSSYIKRGSSGQTIIGAGSSDNLLLEVGSNTYKVWNSNNLDLAILLKLGQESNLNLSRTSTAIRLAGVAGNGSGAGSWSGHGLEIASGATSTSRFVTSAAGAYSDTTFGYLFLDSTGSTDGSTSENALRIYGDKLTWGSNDIYHAGNITKASVGLGNVDNTSDADKPISTATQTALDEKVDKSGGELTGGFSTDTHTLTGTSLTPSSTVGNFFEYTNVEAFTLNVPTTNCSMIIAVTNDGVTAGAMTASGFTKINGTFKTDSNLKQLLTIVVCGTVKLLSIQDAS